MPNFFDLPPHLPGEEFFETLVQGNQCRIERIISTGQTTPAGEWYDQAQDEWVILLQGEAIVSYADGSCCPLRSGDYLWIPAHQKHRVEYTSEQPPCVWLAIHIDAK